MTSLYGSKAQPKRVFGDGTPLLRLFYEVMQKHATGVWELNESLLGLWDPNALVNSWVLPDGFNVNVKVMDKIVEPIHFLNAPYELERLVNKPTQEGRSLPANITHSIDGMVVREMNRRCNFNYDKIIRVAEGFNYSGDRKDRPKDQKLMQLWDRYKVSGFLSARVFDYVDNENIGLVDYKVLNQLIMTMPQKSFQVISVHDCFRCLPNYGNDLRRQYNQIMSEIAGSNLLSDIVSQLIHRPVKINKMGNLTQKVKEANYALS